MGHQEWSLGTLCRVGKGEKKHPDLLQWFSSTNHFWSRFCFSFSGCYSLTWFLITDGNFLITRQYFDLPLVFWFSYVILFYSILFLVTRANEEKWNFSSWTSRWTNAVVWTAREGSIGFSPLFSFGSLEDDVMTLVDELSSQIEVSS